MLDASDESDAPDISDNETGRHQEIVLEESDESDAPDILVNETGHHQNDAPDISDIEVDNEHPLPEENDGPDVSEGNGISEAEEQIPFEDIRSREHEQGNFKYDFIVQIKYQSVILFFLFQL